MKVERYSFAAAYDVMLESATLFAFAGFLAKSIVSEESGAVGFRLRRWRRISPRQD